ncbi:DUF3781 domain-containing protein [Amedibacillus sp. YH-ame10]
MSEKDSLLAIMDAIHTTEMGEERIKRNLDVCVEDIVSWCKQQISKESCDVIRKGKNWYATLGEYVFTINAHSYTIITAHKHKR